MKGVDSEVALEATSESTPFIVIDEETFENPPILSKSHPFITHLHQEIGDGEAAYDQSDIYDLLGDLDNLS